jgi:hypothetical protein
MRLSDKNLIQCALNIYARHLRGFEDNKFAEDLKRVEELRTKEISANDVVIAIKLEI